MSDGELHLPSEPNVIQMNDACAARGQIYDDFRFSKQGFVYFHFFSYLSLCRATSPLKSYKRPVKM